MWNGRSVPGTQTVCRNEDRVLSYIADAFWKHWQKLGKVKMRKEVSLKKKKNVKGVE